MLQKCNFPFQRIYNTCHIITQVMTLKQITGPPTGPRMDGPGLVQKKKTILIVDDELMIPKTLQRILVPKGYSVETCDDPRTALERYKQGGIDFVYN